MNSLTLYEEAARCLEEAAWECNKTEGIDIDLLILNIQRGEELVERLKRTELDQIRMNGLEQLSLSLTHHLNVLVTKRSQLNQPCTVVSNTKDRASSKSGEEAPEHDKQVKSRRIAIEDTIFKGGTVTFTDVAGLDAAKDTLREAIIMPLQFPHLFTGGRKPWRRILLYGPPGTGKTRLAQAVASEVQSTFYSVSSADLISSWVGESEKLIRELFHDARTREGRSVIFIDEIDSVCRKRSTQEEEHSRRVKTELLKQMEGTDNQERNEQFFLLCATNCPWELDSAFIRRFQKRIYIPLPEKEARITLVKMHLGSTPACLTEPEWGVLGDQTQGFSGSDLSNCTSDAMFEPVRELQRAKHWKQQPDGMYVPCRERDKGSQETSLSNLPPHKVHPRSVMLDDFIKSLTHNGTTITDQDLDKFNLFTHAYGQKG